MKENDDLAHLARSVMNEVTDLRTGIKTAKVVNKELYLENQVLPPARWLALSGVHQTILGTTLQTVQGALLQHPVAAHRCSSNQCFVWHSLSGTLFGPAMGSAAYTVRMICIKHLSGSPELEAFKSAHARTLAEIEETVSAPHRDIHRAIAVPSLSAAVCQNQRSVESSVELARAVTSLKDKTEEVLTAVLPLPLSPSPLSLQLNHLPFHPLQLSSQNNTHRRISCAHSTQLVLVCLISYRRWMMKLSRFELRSVCYVSSWVKHQFLSNPKLQQELCQPQQQQITNR